MPRRPFKDSKLIGEGNDSNQFTECSIERPSLSLFLQLQNDTSDVIPHLNLTELSAFLSSSPSSGRHLPPIFFVEADVRLRRFSPTVECAFESAAAHNPGRPVVVVLDSGAAMTSLSPHLRAVTSLHVVKTDFRELTEGIPVEVIQGFN